VIVSSTAVAVVLFLVAAAVVAVTAPRERLGILPFHLAFTGADSGRYPNGTPFDTAEILSPLVVASVFASNDLDRYTTLNDFQEGLIILPSGPAATTLDAEYLPQISSARSIAERVRLEGEYLAKRRAIREPEFDLRLRRSERLTEMPAMLIEAVLSDVLKTWAAQADTQKGAARPVFDAVSRAMFDGAADEAQSYLLRIDVMRTGTERLLAALQALRQIPGAHALRITGNRSVADEIVSVEQILRIDLEMLAGLARITPVSDLERVMLNAYVSKQLVSSRLALDTATTRTRNLQAVLRDYMSSPALRFAFQRSDSDRISAEAAARGTAQVSDAFIEKMMALSAAAGERELEYRRELTGRLIAAQDQAAQASQQIDYYQDVLNQISAAPRASTAASTTIMAGRFKSVFDRVMQEIDRVNAFTMAMSIQMNASGQWYRLAAPFRLQTVSSLPGRPVFVRLLLTALVTFIGAVVACLVYDSRVASRRNHVQAAAFEAPI
jgi:hypothetical protein